MMALLGGLWGRVAAVGAALAAAGAAFAMARRSGVQAQQTADLRKGVADRAKADKVAADVAGLGDSAVVDELHRQYDRQ